MDAKRRRALRAGAEATLADPDRDGRCWQRERARDVLDLLTALEAAERQLEVWRRAAFLGEVHRPGPEPTR